MIFDSVVVKADLAKQLASLERLAAANGDLEKLFLRLEQFVFWSAFATRKLIESSKMSQEFEALKFQVRGHPRMHDDFPVSRVDILNRHKVDRLYDMDVSEARVLGVKTVCNLLIHSFVFEAELLHDRPGFGGLWFNSDRTREQTVWFIEWAEFRNLVTAVVEDYVSFSSIDRIAGVSVRLRDAPDREDRDDDYEEYVIG